MEPTTPTREGHVKLHPEPSLERQRTKEEISASPWAKKTKPVNRVAPYFYPTEAQCSPEPTQTNPIPASHLLQGTNFQSPTTSSTQRSIANELSGSPRRQNQRLTHSESPAKDEYSSTSDAPLSPQLPQVAKTKAPTTPRKKAPTILLPNSSPDGRVVTRLNAGSPLKRTRAIGSSTQDTASRGGQNPPFTRDPATVRAFQLTARNTGVEFQILDVQHTQGGGVEHAVNSYRSPSYTSLFSPTDGSVENSRSEQVQHPSFSSMESDISGSSSFRSLFPPSDDNTDGNGSEQVQYPTRARKQRSRPASASAGLSRLKTDADQEGVHNTQLNMKQARQAQEILSQWTSLESIANQLKRKTELVTSETHDERITALYSAAREKCEALINVAAEARDWLEKRQ